MTAQSAASSIPSPLPLQQYSRNFLSDVVIDYGPRDVLSRLFLKADTALRERGIELSFEPVATMIELNEQNSSSWRPLVPILDSRLGSFSDANGFCVVGRNRQGEVVAAHAARLYRFAQSNLHLEGESLRLWYSDPDKMKAVGETCSITCPSARQITGLSVFSGGVWYRPDYRKLGLTTPIGHIVKAYAYTKWQADTIFTMMIDDVFAGGTAKRAGYTHAEWAVEMANTPLGSYKLTLLWINAAEQLDYFRMYSSAPHAEVYSAVNKGAA